MKKLCILLALLCLFAVACGEEKPKTDTGSTVELSFESIVMPESEDFVIVTAKEFTVGKLEMTLPWDMTNQEVDDVELYAYNEDFVLVVTMESFEDLKASGHSLFNTAADYAKEYIANAELQTPMYSGKDGDIAWFEYAQDMDNGRFHYFAYCLMGSDAYYMCQFVCEEKLANDYRHTVTSTVLNFELG